MQAVRRLVDEEEAWLSDEESLASGEPLAVPATLRFLSYPHNDPKWESWASMAMPSFDVAPQGVRISQLGRARKILLLRHLAGRG